VVGKKANRARRGALAAFDYGATSLLGSNVSGGFAPRDIAHEALDISASDFGNEAVAYQTVMVTTLRN